MDRKAQISRRGFAKQVLILKSGAILIPSPFRHLEAHFIGMPLFRPQTFYEMR